MRDRSWKTHLRLLPGGDSDLSSALMGTAVFFGVFFVVGLIPAFIFRDYMPWRNSLIVVGMSAALPLFLIALWVTGRVLRSKPIDVDSVAASPRHNRVYFGDQIPRVPKVALVVPIRPRQVTVELADQRQVVVWYRAEETSAALLHLARTLHEHKAASFESFVEGRVRALAKELLPDPYGVVERLRIDLGAQGVVIARGELR